MDCGQAGFAVASRKQLHLTPAARRRLAYALIGIGVVLIIGAVGFHVVAGLSPVDSIYFESMLATGQGPPLTLTSDSAKIFASVMAFISVGSVVSTLLFAVGPVIRQVWHNSLVFAEEEVRMLEQEFEHR
jgi:biotin transporter BioY